MPEYLAPGVYVEETSFRSKSIEGVSTSTAGFVGPARWGPVSGRPELITSLADFQRIYGGLDDLVFEGTSQQPNYLAHAVRAFFEEGGKRLYVSRVFNFGTKTVQEIEKYYAVFPPKKPAPVILQARFPGAAGSMRISFTLKAGSNILSWSGPPDSRTPTLTRVQEFTLLYIRKATTASETSAALRVVVNKFVNIAKLLQNVAEAEAGANAQPVKAAIKDVADGLKDTASAVVSALNAASVTTPQSAAQAARAKASELIENPNKQAIADWIATVAEVEASKNGATIQSVKTATQKANDDLKSTTDAITAIVHNVSDTDPKSAVVEALKAEAEKPAVDSARIAADQVAQAAEAKTTTQAEVYQVAKEAANNIMTVGGAVVSAIDIASTATPLSVAQAARTEANKYTADPGKSVANLVAKATEDEAGKTGATPDKVKKAADGLKTIVDAIVGAVDTAAGITTPPTPGFVAQAARTEADKYTTDPGKSVANLVAKATEDAATAGATVEIVKETADDLKTIVDAIASVGDIASAPTPGFVAQAARTEADKYTTDPGKTAAGLVAKVAQTEAKDSKATIVIVRNAARKAVDDMKAAADMVANVTMTPWLPFSNTTKGLFIPQYDATASYWKLNGSKLDTLNPSENPKTEILPITVTVEISRPVVGAQGTDNFSTPELLGEYNVDPRNSTGLTKTFTQKPTTRLEALTTPFAIITTPDPDKMADQDVLQFARDLMGNKFEGLNADRPSADALRAIYTLASGSDGKVPGSAAYKGEPEDFKDISGDQLQMPQNGLLAFEALEDISIVAAPGYSAHHDADDRFAIHRALITHCEKMRYRIAVLDTPRDFLVSGALDFRNLTSSKYAALYYPWIVVAHPQRDERLLLPPSGFVAGIYARNDTERAVFKAPANEVVRLAIDLEQRLNKAQQDVLNPEGVNCFRFFPGHGFKLWGARTISDDPEWKYVNLRRYFAYLEHSIDRGTQWVVFENNSKQLWDNVRRTIEDFLLTEWKSGALMGNKPEEAYFVRCDLSTMTQNDLDNGRLICLIGVAPVRPAEFVIFRIGQWTAERKF